MKADRQTVAKACIALGIEYITVFAARAIGGTLQLWIKGRPEPVEWTPTGEMAQETKPIRKVPVGEKFPEKEQIP